VSGAVLLTPHLATLILGISHESIVDTQLTTRRKWRSQTKVR
jgi:hypothetical protein